MTTHETRVIDPEIAELDGGLFGQRAAHDTDRPVAMAVAPEASVPVPASPHWAALTVASIVGGILLGSVCAMAFPRGRATASGSEAAASGRRAAALAVPAVPVGAALAVAAAAQATTAMA